MEEDSDSHDEGGWIQWFCGLEDNNFFCEVDYEYVKDSFNLYGLKPLFNQYNEALEMILSSDFPEEEELENEDYMSVFQEATDLYGLIHARFITTQKGLALMKEKYLQGHFGVCP